MPYPNEHAARIRDPGAFEATSFRSKELPNGVRIIVAKLKGGTAMVVQAYRFSVDKFTVEEAKKWLEDNKIHYIKFEPASKNGGSMDNEIKHVGVLGMRWGHRKSPDEQWERSTGKAVSGKGFVKIYNSAADRMNATEIRRINNKPEYKGKNLLKDKALEKKYLKEYSDTFSKIMTEETRKVVGMTNPSGTKKLTVISDPLTLHTAFVLEDIKHAADQIVFLATRDENGFIIDISLQDEELIQANIVEEYLQHAGIIGMKWGQRKKRDMPGESGGKKAKKESTEPVRLKKNMPGETGGKKPRKVSPDAKEVASLRKKHVSELSNDELQKVAKRMELEKRYKDLNPSRTTKGKKAINNVFSGIGKTAGLVGSAAVLITVGKKMYEYAADHKRELASLGRL